METGEAYALLRDHGILRGANETRTALEVAQAYGLLPVAETVVLETEQTEV